MIVKFNTKDSKVLDKVLDAMEKKILARFHRYFANEDEDKTTVWVKVVDQKYRYKVELTLTYMGYLLRAETFDDKAPLAALDKTVDIMERQIVKCKTKLSRNKHQTVEIIPDAPTVEEEPDEYTVVRVKGYEMKPMTVQEAILNMNMIGHSFFMFRNSDTDKISTVYKRNDGAYGLIEPQS